MKGTPDASKSDFHEMGLGTVNLSVLLPTFAFVFSLPGMIGAAVAFSGAAGKSSALNRVEEVASLSAGPLYLSMMLVRISLAIALGSLGNARRASGINVPDQHVYKVVGGSAAGSMVLMDEAGEMVHEGPWTFEDGAFGAFNRAQRGIQNIWEQTFPLALETLLAGYIFPWTTAICISIFTFLRCYGALLYTNDRKARLKGAWIAQPTA
eukprot:Skav218958  [mRNA]  locus=scaffold6129:25367:41786:+ [translate_table: standard]